MAKNAAAPDLEPTVPAVPTFVILRTDWPGHALAGRVLRAGEELIAQLNADGISFEPATDQQRRLAGFAD